MIDLVAVGKQVAAELAALNPQVIRNLSARSNPHPVYIPAIPQNPQPQYECVISGC